MLAEVGVSRLVPSNDQRHLAVQVWSRGEARHCDLGAHSVAACWAASHHEDSSVDRADAVEGRHVAR